MSFLSIFLGLAFAQAPPVTAVSGNTASGTTISGTLVVRSLDLPVAVRELRQAGVPDVDIRQALAATQNAGLHAGDAVVVVEETTVVVLQTGPIDNFGAFVQTQLDAGLRGQDLAAAIRAEHVARGKGGSAGKSDAAHGSSADAGKSDADHGKSDAAHGKSDAAGKSDAGKSTMDHGKSGEHGKSDAAGKSNAAGKSDDDHGKGKK